MTHKKTDEKKSFISEARRSQIVEAAIMTLDEIGYIHASMAQIAKKAGISTALISYHFRDKKDLMDYTLLMLLSDMSSYVLERTQAMVTPRDKLRAYIEASIGYHADKPTYNVALIEILFHARTADNVPYYKLDDDEENPLESELQQILLAGQEKKEFGAFNVRVLASAIRGAIDEYVFNRKLNSTIDPQSYSSELVNLFYRVVTRD
ncbi:TetR/AcrR family transcriptional regulator [Brevibacillus brevis]|uniref:TetR/AcrR family transcriptional regulator n=1 Tax=Brevibacillus brevis TaxID=1393 RepID=A0ABY9T6W9_BREBE|nr:TetR/AcrR family transcriptional regulator [Brevibacillus brevis]WNC15856.1 TetR/AcrR family transcriptional regulator [Brevibacillus brevis]